MGEQQAIRARVTGNRLVGEHTEYRVELHAGAAKLSSVSRRFREFTELHAQLSKFHHAFPIPEIPPKKFFGRTSPAFVAKRQRELQVFLDQLVSRIVANPPAEAAWRLLCLFLALDPKQDVPEAILNLADLSGSQGAIGSSASSANSNAGAAGAASQRAANRAGEAGSAGFDSAGGAAMLAVPGEADAEPNQELQNMEAEEMRRMEKIVDDFARQTINVSKQSEERLQVPPSSLVTSALLQSLQASLDKHIIGAGPIRQASAKQDSAAVATGSDALRSDQADLEGSGGEEDAEPTSDNEDQALVASTDRYAPIVGAEDLIVSLAAFSGEAESQAAA